MADKTSPRGNSGDFAKKVQRQLSRGKEKVHSLEVPVSPMARKTNLLPFNCCYFEI